MTPTFSELMILDRHNLSTSFEDGLKFTIGEALAKNDDNDYSLFRSEDWRAWVSFTVVFILLIVFDNVVLHRNPRALTISRAIVYTVFWILCACGFCCGVYFYYGADEAFMWMSGYILEWMLSFDNLFVFHLIFTVYGTPDELKHRPLYLGILGAVVFRLGFIFIGEYLLHTFYFVHFIFGALLIYSGIKTISMDDPDADPSKNPIVMWLTNYVPFVSVYDKDGAFFVQVPDEGASPTEGPLHGSGERQGLSLDEEGETKPFYGTVDFAALAVLSGVSSGRSTPTPRKRTKTKATMLFLVLICLEVSDLIFAVDSVSAIVAQVPDLFLAYTSAVFAMLGLRATFFIIDELARLFSLLKYGVAAVLVFIGIKLMITPIYHISPKVVCAILLGSLASSIIASAVQDAMNRTQEEESSVAVPAVEASEATTAEENPQEAVPAA